MIRRLLLEIGRLAVCLAFLAGLWLLLAVAQAVYDGP